MQEIIVGDLMREFKLNLDQVLEMGFYTCHRLWMIADEIRFREIQHQSLIADFAHSDEEHRREFLDWVRERQPRRYGNTNNSIPPEVLARLNEAFRG